MDTFNLADNTLPNGEFKIYSIPELGQTQQKRQITTAKILSCIPSFYLRLNNLAKKYQIHHIELMPIIDKQSLTVNYRRYLRAVSLTDLTGENGLIRELHTLLDQHKLDDSWLKAIFFLMKSGALLVPRQHAVDIEIPRVPGRYYLPSKPINYEKYVRITVSTKMSPTALANYVRTNSDVKNGLALLPENPPNETWDVTIYWGHHVWAYITYISNSSDEEFSVVYDWLIKHLPDEEVPLPIELAKYYKRFLKAISYHL